MGGRLSRPSELLLLFAALSLAAVAIGAWICAVNGVPAGAWLRDIAAWIVGAAGACLIAWKAPPASFPAALWAAPAGLVATLFSAAQQGVHRWVDLGPLHVNLAMVLLPAAIVGLAAVGTDRRWPWILAFAALALLVVQPDASQATALALPAALIAAFSIRRLSLVIAVIVTAGLLAALAWSLPDPLQPVAEVEGVIRLAFAISPLLAGLTLVVLAAVAATPALAARSSPSTTRVAGLALGLCLLLWAVAPFLGAFPVPFVGVGMSPIIGAWLGVGLLAALLRRQTPT